MSTPADQIEHSDATVNERLIKRIDEKSDLVAASDHLHPSYQAGYLQALDFVLRQLDDLGDF